MKVNKVSRLMRLNSSALAAALLLVITGCDGGGATVSSPFSVQPSQNTQQATTDPITTVNPADDSPEQPAVSQVEPAPQTAQPAPQPNPTPNDQPAPQPSANDQPVEPETFTLSVEAPPQLATVVNPTSADITDLVLVTGQSNALGADTLFDPALDGPDNRTFAWTDNGWQVADLHQIWDQGWFPRADLDTGPSNNLSLHFGKQVTSRDSNRVVGFILATAPGQPISHWQSDGDFFNSIRNKVSQAINALPSKARVDAILWHQGESDGRDDPAYGAALYGLIDAFRSESWYGPNLPFICGETASLPVNRQLNRLNSDNDPSTACIAAEGLETRGDNVHFSASALRTIGRRYADQYLAMTR